MPQKQDRTSTKDYGIHMVTPYPTSLNTPLCKGAAIRPEGCLLPSCSWAKIQPKTPQNAALGFWIGKTHEHIFNPFVSVLIFANVKLQVINARPSSHFAAPTSPFSIVAKRNTFRSGSTNLGGFGQRNAIAAPTEKELLGDFSNGIEMWARHSLHPQWRRSGCLPAVQNASSHVRHETFKAVWHCWAYSLGPAKTL